MYIGYLGPVGTFTHQAARIFFPDGELLPIKDIDGVFEGIAEGQCCVGVVPIENSTEGPVNATLDSLLRHEGIGITNLLILPIVHAILARDSENSGNFEKILAHPQALAQCRGYTRQRYPDAELVECASNGLAASAVSQSDENWAAIGPVAAAREYGLAVLEEGVQDSSLNSTAFIQIEKTEFRQPRQGLRTSIAFSTENKPGTLFRMLGILENYGINMTKILSRPMPGRPGEYIFFVDIEGYREDEAENALTQMQEKATLYKCLGSYPVRRV